MRTNEQRNKAYDVIVIGGGASGMMAAGRAAECGKRVLLLEKNKRLGEKLRITGGGRCNITNAEYDERVLLSHYGKGEQFLYSLFAQFGVKETFSFFEARGLPLAIQAHKRAFPKTEKALDVYRVLEKYIAKGCVEVRAETPITKVGMADGAITSVSSKKEHFQATNYIVATGSVSHPETGSTGDGFKWLANLGHTIIDPTPTVVPLATAERWSKELAGTSLSYMKITFFVDGKKMLTKTGKVLFTHFGLSGPLILNSAGEVSDLLHEGEVTAVIDAYPQIDLGTIEKTMLSVFDAYKNKAFKNVLSEIVPEGTTKGIQILIENEIDLDKKVHSISKEERKYVSRLLKALPLTVTGLMGNDRAVVSDGGLSLVDIDMRTMRSKKVSNLFVTGDLLHITRPSGGYSLQLCWSTGYVAGSNSAL